MALVARFAFARWLLWFAQAAPFDVAAKPPAAILQGRIKRNLGGLMRDTEWNSGNIGKVLDSTGRNSLRPFMRRELHTIPIEQHRALEEQGNLLNSPAAVAGSFLLTKRSQTRNALAGHCLPHMKCSEGDCCSLGSSCNTCPFGYCANTETCGWQGAHRCNWETTEACNGNSRPQPTPQPASDVQTCQQVNVVASTKEALPFANIASQSAGGIPFGSRSLGGYCSDSSGGQGLRSESGIHCWKNINDGKLGNAHSWIPGIANAFVGVRFHSMSEIQGFRLSRKGEGSCCNDRIGGNYEIQYTSSADAGFSTPDSAWCSTGTFTRSSYGFVYFKLSRPVSATAVRIKVSDPGACIDELEVYGVSEAMVPMVDCVVPSGWSRPYGNVELSKSGAERCKRKCADGGYTYFGLECPMRTQVHCQCSNAVGGTSKSFAYCEGAGDPLVHAHGHCSGPYIVGGYRFGDYTVGSVYSTQARAL